MTVLTLSTLALAFIGPDYITPKVGKWDLNVRSLSARDAFDPTLLYPYRPQYTISKAYWTSGGRTGLIAFALLPLCILFALKAPPFALFAIPRLVQLHFDKLSWLHKWCGRFIWFISALHVALWSIQLSKDRRDATGKTALSYAWGYSKFIYGWIAFGLFTFIIVMSLHPIRKHYYEAFYFLHVVTIPLAIITAALHHPPVWWFCWAALALWVGERLWRGTWWLHNNGFFGGIKANTPSDQTSPGKDGKQTSWELSDSGALGSPPAIVQSPVQVRSSPTAIGYPPKHNRTTSGPYEERQSVDLEASSIPLLPSHTPSLEPGRSFLNPIRHSYLPPPGYAHAELLSGWTIRLRFITPGFVSWAPGQHFLVSIPCLSKFTSHPFTCASICDEQMPTDGGRVLVFLIRAKNGWTKELWDRVSGLTTRGQSHPTDEKMPPGTELPDRGVLFRMYVDGPFGSVARAEFGRHSTVLIVAGGSGVSFGLSLLEYVCLCLAGRDGRHLGGKAGGWGQRGYKTTRIRFVWLVREFAHIQWCATVIRRCMDMVPPPGLEINIFVTNFKSIPDKRRSQIDIPYNPIESEGLVPPTPGYVRPTHSRSSSADSTTSLDGLKYVDLDYFTGEYGDELGVHSDVDRENYILDLTNFDGDNDTRLPGEDAINRRVMKDGKLRRAKTREAARAAKKAFEEGATDDVNRDESRGRSGYKTHKRGQPSADSLMPQVPHGRRSRLSSEIDLRSTLDVSPERTEPYWTQYNVQSPPSRRVSQVSRPGSYLEADGLNLSRAPSPSRRVSQVSRPGSYLEAEGLNLSRAPSPFKELDPNSDAYSVRGLVERDMISGEIRLDVDKQEMKDVSVVAEHARPGKPKLDRIIADEVLQARGPIIVACCGPASLNGIVRKSVALQIDPSRIRRGDTRGLLTLISDEFQY